MSKYDEALAKSFQGKGSDNLEDISMSSFYGKNVVDRRKSQIDGFKAPKGSILQKAMSRTNDDLIKSNPGSDEVAQLRKRVAFLEGENQNLKQATETMRRMVAKKSKVKKSLGHTVTLSKSAAVIGGRYKIVNTGKTLRLEKIIPGDQPEKDRYFFRTLNPEPGEAVFKWLDATKFKAHMENGNIELMAPDSKDYKPPQNPQAFGNTSGEGLN